MSRMNAIVITLAVLLVGSMLGWADPTPPIMPHIIETPLPPPVTLPAPESVPADVPNTPLTANEAALIALRHQPSIVVAQQGVNAAKGRQQQTTAGQQPGLTLSSNYTTVPMTSGAGTTTSGITAGASMRQLLFDYNHTRDLVRQSTALTQSAQANLSRAQSDLVFQVKQAYYTYTQAQRLVSVNEQNVKNRQDHLTMAQARVKGGIGLPIDVVRAETAVSDAILSLNLAQNSASIAGVNLAQLMGLDPRTPILVGEGNEAIMAMDDMNALLKTAFARRPEILQAQATVQANQYAINAAKTTNAPVLTGTGGWTTKGANFPPKDSSLSLGLGVSWGVVDGGLTRGKVTEAQANLETAQANLQSTNLTVISDVSQAYLNEKTAEQRLVTANSEVTNAQEGVRLAQGRYNAGFGIFLDVLDAQTALVTAQTNQVNAQSSVNQARAALAHALNSDPVLAPAAALSK